MTTLATRALASLYANRSGERLIVIAHNGINVEIAIDRDGTATVRRCDWEVLGMVDTEGRRKTCSACEHKRAMGKITVTCGLCGCGGLRLDGPAALCRAGKW